MRTKKIKAKSESMKKNLTFFHGAACCVWLLLGFSLLSAFTAVAAEKKAVIENDFVRMEFLPSEGGVCKRLIYKPTAKDLVYTDTGYGLFRDQFWSPKYHAFADVVYQYQISETPESVSIHLWGTGSGGMYTFTEIHKTITLKKGSPLIRADFEITNNLASFADYDYGYWSHNFLGVKGETDTYFYPTTNGVGEIVYDSAKRPKVKDNFASNLARGWLAAVGTSGTGIACGMDFKYLNLFYFWLGAPVSTVEWRYNILKIKSGQSFKTSVTMLPFSGLRRVDTYFDGITGALELPQTVTAGETVRPELTLIAGENRKLKVKFLVRHLPSTEWQSVAVPASETALKTTVPHKMNLPPLTVTGGSTVLRCVFLEGDKEIGDLERLIVAGEPSGKYVFAPKEKSVGLREMPETASSYPAHPFSTEIVTPHVPWGKPLASGKLKALILTDSLSNREIVELIQRFDLDVESATFFHSSDNDRFYGRYGDMSIRSISQARAELKKKLKKNYDVVMIAGLDWTRSFDDEIRQRITEQVKNGTGLVYIAPVGLTGELANSFPFAEIDAKGPAGFLKDDSKHYLTTGLPLDSLPQIKTIKYKTKTPAATPLLSVNKIPVLACGQLGKGRLVGVAWNAYTHDWGPREWNFSSILPIMQTEYSPNGQPAILSDAAGKPVSYRYQETLFSLLGKSLIWASGKEPDVSVSDFRRNENGEMFLSLNAAGKRRSVALELTYRDKFSREEKTQTKSVELTEGENALQLPVPEGLMPGAAFADLRVLDSAGKVLAWASASFQLPGQASIGTVKFERPLIPAGQPASFKGLVTLNGETTGTSLDIQVSDLYGRLLFNKALLPEKADIPVEFTLSKPISASATVNIRLMKNKQLIDEKKTTLLCLKEVDWSPTRYHFMSWYDSPMRGAGDKAYLYETKMKQMRMAELDTILAVKPREFILENGMLSFPLGVLPEFIDVHAKEKVSNYAKTKDKKYLVREPSLYDPVFRNRMKEHIQKKVKAALPFGQGLVYLLADEMALYYFRSYFDFDFSEVSIANFRLWLAKRYSTIDVLNLQWGTAYKDWQEIIPMTLEEAKARTDGNFAPWSDFREFMDDSVADFYSFARACVEELDPKAMVTISGTTSSGAGNGFDWWKLSHSLKGFHTYSTENSQYLHQAFISRNGGFVAPYAASGRDWGGEREFRFWWAMFYECGGITNWMTPNFFYPDLSLDEAGADTRALNREFKSGLWPLLRLAHREQAPIAIHYSMPSVRASFISGREQRFDTARDGWIKLLHDLGFQFDFVAYAQLETAGFLEKAGYKVLILPESLALSDKEAAGIKAFAAAGGIVIADNSAGWMTERCQLRKNGTLDDVFGLQSVREAISTSPMTPKLSQAWGTLKAEAKLPSLAPAGKLIPGKAASVFLMPQAEQNIVYVNRYEKGYGVYLNLNLAHYVSERELTGPAEKAFREIVGGALALGGLKAYDAPRSMGKKPFHGHSVHYTDGSLKYYGVLRDYTSGEGDLAISIKLPEAAYVYDARQRKALGKISVINTVMSPGGAKLFCLSPVELPTPVLKCPASVSAGTPADCEISLPVKTDYHTIIRFEVSSPSGTLMEHYSESYVFAPGMTNVKVPIPFAINDTVGKWTVTAVNIAGGQKTTAEIQLK